jgi:hypothetical protein
MRTIRSSLRVAVLAIVVAFGSPIPAQAATPPIRPNQHFIGLVNNKHVGAVIYVVCPGPAGGDRTGPPAGNQTVKVVRVASGGGYTGSSAHELWAQFNKDSIHVVGFTTYNTAKAIPSSLQLPCSGTGTVTFTTCFGTRPCAANAKNDVVPVTFENLAV